MMPDMQRCGAELCRNDAVFKGKRKTTLFLSCKMKSIGKPDPERTELVKAFVVLHPGYEPTPELTTEVELFLSDSLIMKMVKTACKFWNAVDTCPYLGQVSFLPPALIE